MIVAEQVVAALDGGVVTNAVNIPIVDQADLEVLGLFIPLASQLGRIAVGLAAGRPAGSPSPRTGRSPSTTLACSRRRRSTDRSRAVSTRSSTSSTRP